MEKEFSFSLWVSFWFCTRQTTFHFLRFCAFLNIFGRRLFAGYGIGFFLGNNSHSLSSLVITHALEWPTLTCQWFPDSDQNVQRLLIGTHTSEGSQNYLQIAQVTADYSHLHRFNYQAMTWKTQLLWDTTRIAKVCSSGRITRSMII